LLSNQERSVMQNFRKFLITPGQLLCFNGPQLSKFKGAFQRLTDKGFLVKEKFKGSYSLTEAGFEAMKQCTKA